MSEKLITVITPTYNRKSLLPKLYESLKNQTSYNFEWIVVDDGSTDDTESLIKSFKNETSSFSIKYFYKENAGMFLACKLAVENVKTELIIVIDSDDWMPHDTIEKIENIWNNIDNKNYVGIIGLDCIHKNGQKYFNKYPKDIKELESYKFISYKVHFKDKKYVTKSEILKEIYNNTDFPKPGEKYFNPTYCTNQTYLYGKYYIVNECFCHVEYRNDGLSQKKFLQYYQSPNNYGEIYRLHLTFPTGLFSYFFKESISYTAMYLIAKKPNKIFKDSPKKIITLLAFPFGILYACKILIQNKLYRNDK